MNNVKHLTTLLLVINSASAVFATEGEKQFDGSYKSFDEGYQSDEDYQSDEAIKAEKEAFMVKFNTALNDLRLENLSKNFNDGNDLFAINEAKLNKIDNLLKYIKRTCERNGSGLCELFVFKSEKWLQTAGKFNAHDPDGNYNKLERFLENIFAPAKVSGTGNEGSNDAFDGGEADILERFECFFEDDDSEDDNCEVNSDSNSNNKKPN